MDHVYGIFYCIVEGRLVTSAVVIDSRLPVWLHDTWGPLPH